MSANLLVFATAAFFEIAGCFAFWTWLRRGAAPFVAVLGVGSLVVFAATSWPLLSGCGSHKASGRLTDLIGAGIATPGGLVIIGFAPKAG